MAAAKKSPAVLDGSAPSSAALAVSGERVVMVAKESVKYGGKRYLPGAALLALPDDIDGLVTKGLAAFAEGQDEEAAKP